MLTALSIIGGLILCLLGVVVMIVPLAPSFGVGREPNTFPLGLAIFAGGLGLIFYAGSL